MSHVPWDESWLSLLFIRKSTLLLLRHQTLKKWPKWTLKNVHHSARMMKNAHHSCTLTLSWLHSLLHGWNACQATSFESGWKWTFCTCLQSHHQDEKERKHKERFCCRDWFWLPRMNHWMDFHQMKAMNIESDQKSAAGFSIHGMKLATVSLCTLAHLESLDSLCDAWTIAMMKTWTNCQRQIRNINFPTAAVQIEGQLAFLIRWWTFLWNEIQNGKIGVWSRAVCLFKRQDADGLDAQQNWVYPSVLWVTSCVFAPVLSSETPPRFLPLFECGFVVWEIAKCLTTVWTPLINWWKSAF